METTTCAILLNEREAQVLSLVGTRLTEWDSGMTARVIVGDSALAVYAVLPMDVMVALRCRRRWTRTLSATTSQPRWRRSFRGVSDAVAANQPVRFDTASLLPQLTRVGNGLTLASLPPADGWQMPIHGVSSDITPRSAKRSRGVERTKRNARVSGGSCCGGDLVACRGEVYRSRVLRGETIASHDR